MDSTDIKTEEQDLGTTGLNTPSPVTSALEEPQIATSSFTPINNVFQQPNAPQSVPRAFHPPAAVMDQGDGNNEDSLFMPLPNELAETTNTPYRMTQHSLHANGEDATNFPPPTRTKRVNDESKASSRRGQNKRSRPSGYDDSVESLLSQYAVDQACFTTAQNLTLQLCDPIISKIDELVARGYDDNVTRTMGNKVKDLRSARLAQSDELRVGMLGDTGVGKSALANRLCNKVGITKEVDSGKSGTSVITELASSTVEQAEPIRAVVYYTSNSKIETQVTQYVKDCFHWHALDTDDQTLDSQELDQLSMDYRTAIIFFSTVLCGSADFSTKEATEAFFASARPEMQTAIISSLKQRVQDYVDSLKKKEGATIVAGNSMDEVDDKLRTYRGPVKNQPGVAGPVPSPWPLVRKIRIHLSARILRSGLVLADMPGTSDTNRSRSQIGIEYITECGVIIVVHPIKRMQDQDSLWANVQRCIRGGKQYETILVCTYIDDMNHELEQEEISSGDRATINALKSREEELQEDIQELEYDRDGLDQDDKASRDRIADLLRDKEQERAGVEAKWKEARIQARNHTNIAILQQAYQDRTRARFAVPVFCVSNSGYLAYMNGTNTKNGQVLSLEATGIPGLRQYLLGLQARQSREVMLKLCTKSLPRVLRALEMQCMKSRHEKKQSLDAMIVKPLDDFRCLAVVVKTNIKDGFEGMLKQVMTSNGKEWLKAAKRQHEAWTKNKYPRYGAHCHRNGRYKPKQDDLVDWNVQIAQICEDNLLDAFDGFNYTLEDVRISTVECIIKTLKELSTEFSECPQLMGQDATINAFTDIIKTTHIGVNDQTRELFKELQSAINTIRYNATELESSDSYFMASMTPAYDAADARKIIGKKGGPGTYNDMKAIISTKLYGPRNIFTDVIDAASAAFDVVFDTWHADLVSAISRELYHIVNALNHRFDNEEPEDEEKRAFRQELLVVVKEAIRTWETKMVPQVKLIESFD
ncbi:hypothetical protein LTR17_019160 [Elasticomyces elasticus]|nr:hypothetical protein LTR17_019160 [Elasticomyces elasticus]